MSYILRHGASKEGLPMSDDGWVNVSEFLQLPSARKDKITIHEIIYIVKNNDKQRFALKEENGVMSLRANQGHTIEVDVEMTPITAISDLPSGIAIHGTYFQAWNEIKKSGLSPMRRNHIHFAAGLPGQSGVISGMRSTAEVLIYLDVEKCLAENIPLFLSANNVILSPGNSERLIPPKYFLSVVNGIVIVVGQRFGFSL